MRVQLLLPIATLHGKLNGKAKFYFKTVNGKTFVQRCPDRSTGPVTESQLQARARFAAIAKEVKRMLDQGSNRTAKRPTRVISGVSSSPPTMRSTTGKKESFGALFFYKNRKYLHMSKKL